MPLLCFHYGTRNFNVNHENYEIYVHKRNHILVITGNNVITCLQYDLLHTLLNISVINLFEIGYTIER